MDARRMSAMVEATRLTRQGRLVEATALIQRPSPVPPAPGRLRMAKAAGETGGTSGRQPAPSPALPAREGGQLRTVLPAGFIAAALSAAGSLGLDLSHGPAAGRGKRPAARFDSFSYTDAAGTRAYRLYVPAGARAGPCR